MHRTIAASIYNRILRDSIATMNRLYTHEEKFVNNHNKGILIY
jgi:hypothetical protein